MPKNGEDWGKLIVAKGYKKLPKAQNIAQSGHTAHLIPSTQVPIYSLSTTFTDLKAGKPYQLDLTALPRAIAWSDGLCERQDYVKCQLLISMTEACIGL